MRIEQPWSLAAWTTSRTRSAEPMLPGLMRRQAAPASAASIAALVVEMDVGDDRHLALRARSAFSASADSSSGQETRTMSAPASLQRLDLLDRAFDVAGQRVGHRLDGDRRVAADRHLADMDLAAVAALDVAIGPDTHVNLADYAAAI